ncbi:MAG: hypothetical protein GWP66_13710, partial [Gammaproteobacteria bacterium]|nr:hypothetical protein [Gammaproteobacteria bacterium]
MSVPTPDTLATRLESTLLRDRPRLRRALRRLRRNPDPDAARRLAEKVADACARAALRRERLPRPTFPAELPITAHLDEVGAALAAH